LNVQIYRILLSNLKAFTTFTLSPLFQSIAIPAGGGIPIKWPGSAINIMMGGRITGGREGAISLADPIGGLERRPGTFELVMEVDWGRA
jgi:hypothetical protein